MPRRRGCTIWPNSVSASPPVRRSNSFSPSSCSSLRIATVSAGCETLQADAARVKFKVRAEARKYRIWCISIGVSPP